MSLINVVCFWVGFILGAVILWLSNRSKEKPVGTLREDNSDPDGSYLFLEIEPGGVEKIRNSDTVCFKVKLENYIK